MNSASNNAPRHQFKPLLDYSQSISDTSWGSLTNFVYPTRAPFFARAGWCPYCRTEAPPVFDRAADWRPDDNDDPCLETYFHAEVWSCRTCGWWDLYCSENSGHDSVDPVYISAALRHGVLRTYDITEAELPIGSLRRALRQQGDRILDIHPAMMEDLVASVFRDHFPNCIARVCGRAGDRGIDLIVVESDRTVAVQVKHRMRPDAVERVMQVREFLGAGMVEGFDNLVYVSTADHFSNGPTGARQFAIDAVNRRIVESFELINRHRFLGMLRLVRSEDEEPWRTFVPGILLTDKP